MAALEVLLNEKIDLVITDLNMPKMDGLQLTREIRKILLIREFLL